ncbi:MAG: hypothetical protein B7Z74_00985 [Deltaproteobacteria bacterium 21-66-5]|nr:MAG: hypothetical protein B7Z74_00985 [Deltaproteobacteria bacterium 21-66-5]
MNRGVKVVERTLLDKALTELLFANRYRSGTNLALLEPDVRAAFPTAEAVNQALQSLIKAKA